jgi:hypothetical protein
MSEAVADLKAISLHVSPVTTPIYISFGLGVVWMVLKIAR